MLTRTVRRAFLDTRWSTAAGFCAPCTANVSTVSHTTEASNAPEVLVNSATKISGEKSNRISDISTKPKGKVAEPSAQLPPPSTGPTPILSESIRTLLPLLRAQSTHYITAHIYGKRYLLTQGDTLRLPFLMHGVEPGDVLRLNRATNLGSRDFTLKAAAKEHRGKSPTASAKVVIEPVVGTIAGHQSLTHTMPGAKPSLSVTNAAASGQGAAAPVDHFVPHQQKGLTPYLDERMFVCRAVVMGTEAEPMRIKEKTKRRNRKIKRVKSKHRFTILKVKELRIRSLDEIEKGDLD